MVSPATPSSYTSPHKATKVWKRPAAAETGVPSMFAHATLSKPLKINASVTTAVTHKQRHSNTATTSNTAKKDVATANKTGGTPVVAVVETAATKNALSKSVAAKKDPAEAPQKASNTTTRRSPTKTPAHQKDTNVFQKKDAPSSSIQTGMTERTIAATTTKPSSVKKPSSTTKQKAASKSTKTSTTRKTNPQSSITPSATVKTTILGDSTSVAGTPTSWPKPHSLTHTTSTAKPPKVAKQPLHPSDMDIDELIPAMYRKAKAKPESMPQELRDVLYQLKQADLAAQEASWQAAPIQPTIEETLQKLQATSKEARQAQLELLDDASSHHVLTKTEQRRLKEKLAFFHSHHSMASSSSSSSSSSDESSFWDSDEEDDDDGLFRG